MIEHWILEAFREDLFKCPPKGWIKIDCEWCSAECVSPPPEIYEDIVKNIHYMCNECKDKSRTLEALEEMDDGEERALGA